MARSTAMGRVVMGLAVLGLLAATARIAGIGPFSPDQAPDRLAPELRDGGGDQTPSAVGPAPTGARMGQRPVPRLDAAERMASALREAEQDRDKRARRKLAGLFQSDCNFGVEGHCREWSELASQCDDGDPDACVRLGRLLIDDSPSQPLWGALLLDKACALGRDEVCPSAADWLAWSRYGYRPPPASDQPPDGLSEQCEAGHSSACGLLYMRQARSGEPLDRQAAMTSCQAGFRDLCAALFESATAPADAIAALSAGCDVPDAALCLHLAGYYSDYCTGPDAPANCPTADPHKAAHYRELACRLDPSMAGCPR